MDNSRVVCIDCESLKWADEVPGKWGNIKGFGLACLVIIDNTDKGRPKVFTPDVKVWEALKETKQDDYDILTQRDAQRLIDSASMILSFNGHSFDFPLLASCGFNLNSWYPRSVDICERFFMAARERISLQAMAEQWLGEGKLMDGLKAVKLWRGGLNLLRAGWQLETAEFQKETSSDACQVSATDLFWRVIEYCALDCYLTGDVYNYLRKHEKIGYTNSKGVAKEVSVDVKKWVTGRPDTRPQTSSAGSGLATSSGMVA